MKFLTCIFLTALLAFATGLYLPWWSVAIAAFVISSLIYQPPFRAFLTGFLALFILWLIILLKINSDNEGILSQRMSTLIGLGGSGFNLMLLTCLLGAIVGGLGALTGSLMRRVF